MNLPGEGTYIDIHDHGPVMSEGKFSVENLMAHENMAPDSSANKAYSIGIHPWHLTSENLDYQLKTVRKFSVHANVIAIGEAGFDRLRGPDMSLQKEAFTEQVRISEDVSKPLFIHCVRAWEELVTARRETKAMMPWIVHGFRGKRELALQLVSKGMYISFWFDFIIRPESSQLIRSLPGNRIFLETDGSGTEISDIYVKVAADLEVSVEELMEQIHINFRNVFYGQSSV